MTRKNKLSEDVLGLKFMTQQFVTERERVRRTELPLLYVNRIFVSRKVCEEFGKP